MEGIDVREEELSGWLEADVSFLSFFSFVGFLVGGVARRRFGVSRWEPRMFGTTLKLMRRLRLFSSLIPFTSSFCIVPVH